MAARTNFLSSLMISSLILYISRSLSPSNDLRSSFTDAFLIGEPASQILFIGSLLNRYRFSSRG